MDNWWVKYGCESAVEVPDFAFGKDKYAKTNAEVCARGLQDAVAQAHIGELGTTFGGSGHPDVRWYSNARKESHCNAVTKTGDGLDAIGIVSYGLGCSPSEAHAELVKFLVDNGCGNTVDTAKLDEAKRARQKAAEIDANKKAKRVAQQRDDTWNAASNCSHAKGVILGYLRHRGIHLSAECLNWRSLRLALNHELVKGQPSEGVYDAILMEMVNAAGDQVTLNQIYLEGACKAPVEKPKKLFPSEREGSAAGSFCEVSLPDFINESGAQVVEHISEGFENACAILSANPHEYVVATCNANLLASHQPRGCVTHIKVWVDLDLSGTGLDAAMKLHGRMQEQGVKVSFKFPESLTPQLPVVINVEANKYMTFEKCAKFASALKAAGKKVILCFKSNREITEAEKSHEIKCVNYVRDEHLKCDGWPKEVYSFYPEGFKGYDFNDVLVAKGLEPLKLNVR